MEWQRWCYGGGGSPTPSVPPGIATTDVKLDKRVARINHGDWSRGDWNSPALGAPAISAPGYGRFHPVASPVHILATDSWYGGETTCEGVMSVVNSCVGPRYPRPSCPAAISSRYRSRHARCWLELQLTRAVRDVRHALYCRSLRLLLGMGAIGRPLRPNLFSECLGHLEPSADGSPDADPGGL